MVDDLEISDEKDGGALVPLRLNLAAGSRSSVTVDRFTVYDDSEESSDDPGFRGSCVTPEPCGWFKQLRDREPFNRIR